MRATCGGLKARAAAPGHTGGQEHGISGEKPLTERAVNGRRSQRPQGAAPRGRSGTFALPSGTGMCVAAEQKPPHLEAKCRPCNPKCVF